MEGLAEMVRAPVRRTLRPFPNVDAKTRFACPNLNKPHLFFVMRVFYVLQANAFSSSVAFNSNEFLVRQYVSTI